MDTDVDILFSSFLAGALLKNKSIKYIELANEISRFEATTNCNIVDDGLDKLSGIVCDHDFEIRLERDYSDVYNNVCTIKEYLYSMTNIDIRRFFGVVDINIENNNVLFKSKPGILKKIKTRVFR